MKGIILAGGNGSRLKPLTETMNKHLLPVYNRQMILYPLDTLKHFGIKDILIVSGGNHIGKFCEFLGDGSGFGVDLTYRVQKNAGGVAEALGLAKKFSNGDSVSVVLGDNIFENSFFSTGLDSNKCHLFYKKVDDAARFGVLDGYSIVEKPTHPKSNNAVTGFYIYPPEVFDVIPSLKPSARGEIEITDVNNYFLTKGNCETHEFAGFWSDAGTFESLMNSSNWASTVSPE